MSTVWRIAWAAALVPLAAACTTREVIREQPIVQQQPVIERERIVQQPVERERVVVVQPPAPPPVQESPGAAPYTGARWVPGYWNFAGNDWVWVTGRWQ